MGSLSLPHGWRLDFGDVTHVMAVINLSPESQQRHSIVASPEEALERARRFRDLGVTVFDLGGQSSHYDNPTIAADEEVARLLPAVDLLATEGMIVSVDTWKPSVAAACLDAGAALVNDTGGLGDPRMRQVVADSRAGAVLMYVEGANPHDVDEILIAPDKSRLTAAWMKKRMSTLAAQGITETIVDPGIAINYRGDYDAYTRMQLDVIRSLHPIRSLGRPILVPIPRKREDHRVAAYVTMALEYGADMIRVHDVEVAMDLVSLYGRTAS